MTTEVFHLLRSCPLIGSFNVKEGRIHRGDFESYVVLPVYKRGPLVGFDRYKAISYLQVDPPHLHEDKLCRCIP